MLIGDVGIFTVGKSLRSPFYITVGKSRRGVPVKNLIPVVSGSIVPYNSIDYYRCIGTIVNASSHPSSIITGYGTIDQFGTGVSNRCCPQYAPAIGPMVNGFVAANDTIDQ